MPKNVESGKFDDFEKRLREEERGHLDLLHLLNNLDWLRKLLALFEVLLIHIKSNVDKIKMSEDDEYLLNLKNFKELIKPNVGEENNINIIVGLPEYIKEMKWGEFLEYLERAFKNLFNSLRRFSPDEKLKNKVLKTLNEFISQIDFLLKRLPELLPFDQILIKDRPSPVIINIREKYRKFLESIKREAEDVKDEFEDEVLRYFREIMEKIQGEIKKINTEDKFSFKNSLEEMDLIMKFFERLIGNISLNPEIIKEKEFIKEIDVFYNRICVICLKLFYYKIQVGNVIRNLSRLFGKVDIRRLKKKEKAKNLFDNLKENFEIVLKQIEETKKKITSLISEINQLENLSSVEVPRYKTSLKDFFLKNFESLIKLLDDASSEIQGLFEEIESIKKIIDSK